MRSVRDFPIKYKLIGIIMLTSVAALILTCIVFIGYEQLTFRRTMVRDFSILADVIQDNIAPGLDFKDAKVMEKTLQSMHAQPHILAGAVYDKDGKRVASFERNKQKGDFSWPVKVEVGSHFQHDRLNTFQRIILAGEVIGTLYIASDLGELNVRQVRYMQIGGVALLLSGFLAYLLATRLQRVISEPILGLAKTASRVATEKDYALRAAKRGQDELGSLIDRFNEMLEQIQRQARSLQDANDQLEQRVEGRTRELREEIAGHQRAREELTQAQSGAVNMMEEAVHNRKKTEQALEDLKHEVAERRKVEAQLLQAQKMDAIGQLAGGIAHDFNNILGAISMNAELAKLDSRISPATTECFDAIMKASQRASDLVKQILAFSRRQEQERRPMRLQIVVREALKLLRATLPTTIGIDSNLANAPTVLADPTQIHQVIMNLCTNASHAMKDRPGTLKVELAEIEVDAGFAQTHGDLHCGRHVRLTVADSGCGMDRATQERIFEPFFTTKAPGEGTGLGLSVVHGIMKSHDGEITVYSQPRLGTTFHLYFPVFAAETTEPTAEAQPVPRGNGENILFVDDEATLAKLGRAVLENLGYKVTAETSSTEALAAFRDQPDRFHLVITDLTMPVLNGTSLARELLDIRPQIPIILTTGYSATLTVEAVREMGFRDLLLKPNTIRTLGETAHRVLANSRPR